MAEKSLEEQVQALQDRLDIIEVLGRFATCIDRRRWADFEACFAEEVDLNTIRTGQWTHFKTSDLVARLQRAFESYTATQHISANHQVEIDGNQAVVWSTLNATHYLKGFEGGEFQQQVGYYEYHLARQDRWRITKVQQFAHWQRGNQEIFDRTVR
jgi:hypothetical protein